MRSFWRSRPAFVTRTIRRIGFSPQRLWAETRRGLTTAHTQPVHPSASASTPVIDLSRGHPTTDFSTVAETVQALMRSPPAANRGVYDVSDSDMQSAVRDFLCSAYGEPHFAAGGGVALVPAGTRDAIERIIREFTKPGDAVIVDEYTYFHVIEVMHRYQLTAIPVRRAADGTGIDTHALERYLKQRSAAAPAIRLAYVMPSHHNPSGVSMTNAQRAHLIELAARYRFGLIGDEIFHHLTHPTTKATAAPALDSITNPALYSGAVGTGAGADAGSGVPFAVSVSSLSKTLSAEHGIDWTMGWCVHHAINSSEVVQRINRALTVPYTPLVPNQAVFSAPNRHSRALLHAFRSGVFIDQMRTARAVLGRRAQLFEHTLRTYDTRGRLAFRPVGGGYFSWLQVPKGVSEAAFIAAAHDTFRVKVMAGSRMYTGASAARAVPLLTDNEPANAPGYVRACFAIYSDADIAAGARRLVDAANSFFPPTKS